MKTPLTLFLLCLTSPLLGQSIIVRGEMVFPLGNWQLAPTEVRQVNSAIVISYLIYSGTVGDGGWQSTEYLRNVIEVNGPALITKGEITLEGGLQEEPALLDHLAEAGYDPLLGSGWVDTTALGFSYVRYYPWIWHPQLGWLYTVDGPVAQAQRMAVSYGDSPTGGFWTPPTLDESYLPTFPNTPPDELDFPVHEGQSYYLWSPEHGWLLKADLSHLFWSYEENDWLDLLNLVD